MEQRLTGFAVATVEFFDILFCSFENLSCVFFLPGFSAS